MCVCIAIIMQHAYLLCADDCVEEVTNIPGSNITISLKWPELSIGQTATVQCPCANLTLTSAQQLTATRYCGGDFIRGGAREVAMQDTCNFTDTARALCQISSVSIIIRNNVIE